VHLSPTAKSGLLAAALVGGAFLLLAVAFAAFLAADRASGQPVARPDPGSAREIAAGEGLADRPVSEGSERDDESYILGHRWWGKRPTRADLDRIVRLVIETNRGSAVLIDRTARTGRSSRYHDVAGWLAVEPQDLGTPRLVIECTSATRPDRRAVLSRVRAELDRAEYRDGPGR
jgi:hypothetical protein